MFGGKKLNKTDRKHLREMNIYTKYQFEKQVEHMKNELKKHPTERFVCLDCRRIADKLGMWGE